MNFLEMFKKIGAWAILGAMVSGLIVFIPPIYQASAKIFSLGKTFSDATNLLESHSLTLVKHQSEIEDGQKGMREFRSVWCMDRLSSPGMVNPYVLKACTEWIKGP